MDIFISAQTGHSKNVQFFSTRPQESCKIDNNKVSPRLKKLKKFAQSGNFKMHFFKKVLDKNFCFHIFDCLTAYSLSWYIPIFWDQNLCLRPLQRRCGSAISYNKHLR